MENNRQNNSDDLLRQILTETSADSAEEKREEKREENCSPFTAGRTEPRETAAVVHEAAPAINEEAVYEDRTTVHKAARPESSVDLSERKAQDLEDSLYSDLDGISQTQVHKKKTNAANNTKSRKKAKKKGNRALRSIILTAVILCISLVCALLIITYGKDVLGVNNDNATRIITIPTGAGTEEIAEILEDEGIITHPMLFKVMAGLSGKDANFTAGDHELRADMAYDTIFENLASPSLGSKDVVSIAFPEGIRLVEAAELLEDQGVCDADAFIEYFNNKSKFGLDYESHLPSFTNDKFYKMEGYLFPDTYQFYTNMDVDLVCQKILRNFNDKITDRDYERMNTLGISLDETLILASLIQREAGSLDQMTRISSVFWNRLNNPEDFPKLQSDPTSGYVEDFIKPHIDNYNEEMFNGYDTYICDGLPAGAICNPGYDAIQAALNPASTDYFFFYSNINTKETYFSRTLAEHEAWIKKVEGHQYVATEPVSTEEATNVVVGVGTGTGENAGGDAEPSSTVTTTTGAVTEEAW